MTPSSDTWVDQSRLEAKIINTEGNYAETFNNAVEAGDIDPQTGFGPILWDSWETNWTGVDVINTTRERTETPEVESGEVFFGGGRGRTAFGTRTTTTFREQLRQTVETGVESRTGTSLAITEQFDQTSVGDRVVSRDLIPFMRSRNIEFISKRVKPLTRLYAFFEGVDVTKYCVPKLLEIEMLSGTFEVGRNCNWNCGSNWSWTRHNKHCSKHHL